MKSQTAIEFMIIIGVLLVIIVPLSTYIWRQNEVSTRSRQAEIAADTIASTAENIYAQGPGATTTISIYFPFGYNYSRSNLTKNQVRIGYYTGTAYGSAVRYTRANITGSLPKDSGYKWLKFELINGFVNVTTIGD